MLFLHHLVTLEDEWYVVCTIFEYIVCPSTYSYRDYQLYDRSAKIDFLRARDNYSHEGHFLTRM